MTKIYELCGYLGIALTIIGQILIGLDYFAGQSCWLAANALYLFKAVKQQQDRAEIVRNVAMSAITLGLMVVFWFA